MADKPQPVRVLYCGVCDLPAEYCEYGSDFEKCKPWLQVHASNLYPDLLKEESDADKTAQQLQSAPISAFPDAGESDASAVPSGASKMPLLLFDPFC